MRRLLQIILGVSLITGSASPASAQFASSFDQLENVTKPGQTLFVIDREGNETRGRLAQLSEQSITLSLKRGERQFAADDIIVIRTPGNDSVLNGAAIGGTVAASVVAISYLACEYCSGFVPVVVGEFVIGAGIGALIDAFILTPRDIYRVGKHRIDVKPVVTPTRQGAQFVLRW